MAATRLPLLRAEVESADPVPKMEQMEQNAMAWVLARWHNGFHEGADRRSEIGAGDLSVHFPGVDQKFHAMARYLDRLETPGLVKDLQVPLSNMSLQDDIDGFLSRVRRAREVVARGKAEQLLVRNPFLSNQIRNPMGELNGVLLEEVYTEESMIQATLAAEAALSAAAVNAASMPDDAGDRHPESKDEPIVEGWNEFRVLEKLGT